MATIDRVLVLIDGKWERIMSLDDPELRRKVMEETETRLKQILREEREK
jgi:hypothetical protein